MALLKQTQQQYYSGRRSFTGDGTTLKFTLSTNLNTFPNSYSGCDDCITVYIDGDMLAQTTTDSAGLVTINWQFLKDIAVPSVDHWYIDFTLGTVPANGAVINIEVDPNWAQWREEIINYQFINIETIINNFMVVYTGEDKILSKVKRTDVQFHAMRALQELSYDTLKSVKSQEIEIPPSLTMMIPHDYVNYVKFTWSDSAGIEHIIYPASKTSNPKAIKQETNGEYSFDIDGDGFEDTDNLISPENSDTWNKYKAGTPSENQDDYQDDIFWPAIGGRYGLDPQYAQVNGSFFIDELKGLVHFSSNISGKTIILKYISDGLGTDEEMIVHKFAEEAMYKWIMYAIISGRQNVQEYVVQRLRKERFAETRKAKLRLSNLKLEELSQVLKGKAKQIKH
jgi:hypothetical protein